MSMSLMVKAMSVKVGTPVRKLVLLKLADQANDKGECWPSYQSIADAAECSRRAAITHIDWLQENGFLRIEKRRIGESQNLTNVYHLTLEKGSEMSSLGSEMSSLGGSEMSSPKPVNNNQSMNHSTTDVVHSACENTAPENGLAEQPKRKPKRTNRHDADLALLAKHGITGQLAEDHLAVRLAKRQPLTETALSVMAKEAEKCGMTLLAALEYATANGWASFRQSYLQNRVFGGVPANANAGKPSNIKQVPVHTTGGVFLAKDVF